MSKLDWSNIEEKRKYDREYHRLRKMQYPELYREASARYRRKHPRPLMDSAVKSQSLRDARRREWAPGGARYQKRQEKAKAREIARLEKAAAKIKRHEEAKLRERERRRVYALNYYYSNHEKMLDRPWDRKRSLESAMRRVLNRPAKEKQRAAKELSRLTKAAHSVLRKKNRRIQARLNRVLRRRFQKAFKYGANYSKTIRELVGCSVEQLRRHLESLWQPGMSWENYGFEGWHIDHKQPCAAFDMTNESDRRQCFHFSNLQPLWAKQNLDKRDRII